jgi:hypothetical protein
VAYLGLRYYLHNEAARTDQWAREVAASFILNRTEPAYFRTPHFKNIDGQGAIEHREIFAPGPIEALAEAALLEECAPRRGAFGNLPCVFSYPLLAGDSRSGYFDHYMPGLRRRHEEIAKACSHHLNGDVQYCDIRKFYPSISIELATKTWHERCEAGRLSTRFREIGAKLITDHSKAAGQKTKGLLTGPMLSHLVGNLVLRKMDENLSKSLPVAYFRYVDDIVLVGERDAIRSALPTLRDRLADLGFELYDDRSPKSITVSASIWLEGRDDFSQPQGLVSWPALINSMKLFLLKHPDQREALQSAFGSEALRLPVRDYSRVVRERDVLEEVRRLSPTRWFRRRAQTTLKGLVNLAVELRVSCKTELQKLLEHVSELSGYQRKRRVPKLRHLAGMLIYLADDASLLELASATEGIPELHLHSRVMKAVATGRIDEILSLGTNAAQAAAQPLVVAKRGCSVSTQIDSDVKHQGLAIFLFNGVPVALPANVSLKQSVLLRFASSGADMDLMRTGDPYIRELACLHGLEGGPRHADMLTSAFDEDEELAMDAVEQLQESASP